MQRWERRGFNARRELFLINAMPDELRSGGASFSNDLLVWDGTAPFDITKTVALHGVLFAKPQSSLTKAEVLPLLPYFNLDSGPKFDFLCVGYEVDDQTTSPIAVVGEKKWTFSNPRFITTKEQFQKQTRWTYGGGVDLILCNQIVDVTLNVRWFDFKSAVCVSIDELINKKYITNFDRFFQNVVNFAKKYEGNRPSWDFSDRQGLRLLGNTLRESIANLLPKAFRKSALEAEYFAVRDIHA